MIRSCARCFLRGEGSGHWGGDRALVLCHMALSLFLPFFLRISCRGDASVAHRLSGRSGDVKQRERRASRSAWHAVMGDAATRLSCLIVHGSCMRMRRGVLVCTGARTAKRGSVGTGIPGPRRSSGLPCRERSWVAGWSRGAYSTCCGSLAWYALLPFPVKCSMMLGSAG